MYLKLSDSHLGYVFNLTDSDAGIIQSMDARLRTLEARRAEVAASYQRKTDKLAKVEAELAKGWEHAAKYQELRTRLEALNGSLPMAGAAPDNTCAQLELAAEAFLPTTPAGDESNPASLNLATLTAADSNAQQAQLELPAPSVTAIVAQTIPTIAEIPPYSTTLWEQLLAQREQMTNRKRARTKSASSVTTQMSFDWA